MYLPIYCKDRIESKPDLLCEMNDKEEGKIIASSCSLEAFCLRGKRDLTTRNNHTNHNH